MRFTEVALAGPGELTSFYHDVLELAVDGDAIRIGETTLRFTEPDGEPFYHFAFLVPGNRFAGALAWARERVEVLGGVFDSDEWDSCAVYFHDPADNIVELIAHHGLEESPRSGAFGADELVGLSELGVVGDRPALLRALQSLGLALFRGTVGEPGRLAFVGERGRTFILAPPGRGWMPTGRPAEPYPVTALIETPEPARFEL
jgi:hypothetical protein